MSRNRVNRISGRLRRYSFRSNRRLDSILSIENLGERRVPFRIRGKGNLDSGINQEFRTDLVWKN